MARRPKWDGRPFEQMGCAECRAEVSGGRFTGATTQELLRVQQVYLRNCTVCGAWWLEPAGWSHYPREITQKQASKMRARAAIED